MTSRYELNAPLQGPSNAGIIVPASLRLKDNGSSSATTPDDDDDILNVVEPDYQLRKRRVWSPEEEDSLASEDIDLLDDFLHKGHRPPLPSFSACFKSIFRIHTETGNIWTHLLGCVMFIGVAIYFLTRPSFEIQFQEKLIFLSFFIGAIVCLGFSFAFHTLCCHSEMVGKLFSKLDYCGIALLIMGSFVPWLYYGFYCHYKHKMIYLTVVIVLGITSIITSLWDKFSQPNLRPLRAGVFMSFGLSGIIPAIHYVLMEGWISKVSQASLGWLILMGLLYILGALFYALRVPERWFPGKCDIWFQSHQIFHVLVLVAAFVHYHGISEMAMYRVTVGECDIPQHPAISF